MTLDSTSNTARPPKPQHGKIKCVVWDLDNTVWSGVLVERDNVRIIPEVRSSILELDRRGILHSIASRNDMDHAWATLEGLELAEYFLYPQINWGSKSASIQRIATELNIGLDTIAFVDDQPFEREEVAHTHPRVTCVDSAQAGVLPKLPEFTPLSSTPDSRNRRQLYRSSIARQQAEEEFVGTNEEFLATLKMAFTIREARADDLQRAEELTVRTNQLNSTGSMYSYEELDALRTSGSHLLLVATLQDKFGTYGTIGLALVETAGPIWKLKLLLMSCRVMSRGVGTVLLNHIVRMAANHNVRLWADFVPTDRNRVMYVTYRFAGFEPVETNEEVEVLAAPDQPMQEPPGYLRFNVEGETQ